jgi:hypothetical protein
LEKKKSGDPSQIKTSAGFSLPTSDTMATKGKLPDEPSSSSKIFISEEEEETIDSPTEITSSHLQLEEEDEELMRKVIKILKVLKEQENEITRNSTVC